MAIRPSGYPGLDARIAGNGAHSIWIGDRIQLRAHEPEDLDALTGARAAVATADSAGAVATATADDAVPAPRQPAYDHSADQRSGWMIMPPQSRVASGEEIAENAARRSGPDTLEFHLVVARRSDNVAVGGVNTTDADQLNGVFSYGIGILPDHKGNGYAAEAVVLLLRFMFDERRFQKCETRVYDYNDASLTLHRKLGFVEEGRLRRHLFLAGEFRDEVLFGMTADEFRQLYPRLKSRL